MKAACTAILLFLAHGAFAQTAPADQTKPTGICKDGSFTTTVARDGACHGHKGIKTWYGISSPSQPVPTPANSPSLPVPAVTTSTSQTLPAPTIVPASPTTTLPAPTPTSSVLSRPAATLGTAATSSLPAPTPVTTTSSAPIPQPGQITVKPGGIAAERARMASMPPAEGGGPGMVWVNNASKVYHCPGSDFYGKTKNGTYMTEAEAKASGAHPNRNKPCT